MIIFFNFFSDSFVKEIYQFEYFIVELYTFN